MFAVVAAPGVCATAPSAASSAGAQASSVSPSALEQEFQHTIRPFVTKYCIGCHSGKMPAAQFDLK
jgi:hypothetical protein